MPFISGFVHSMLAWGALLAAVPLLIHLLNRQRHRPQPWAAMKFVLEAYRRTRRRAQLENLLLLLLRMAAVALLAFAIARPFTDSDSALAPLTERRRDVALVIDASASTGYRESVSSVHEEILDRARDILTDLDGTRGDRVHLLRASTHASLLPSRTPENALAVLSTLTVPDDEPLDLAATLGEVVRLAEENAAGTGQGNLEVRLLTDLQRNSFLPEVIATSTGDGAVATVSPILRALDRLEELGVTVVVEDLGPSALTPPNLGIESIEALGEKLHAGVPAEIAVTVRNFGSTGRAGVRVALEVDGRRQPSRTLEVPPRGTAQAVFPLTLHESGYHGLEARLEGDRLTVDDTRALVVHVPPPIRVLLVNGDPRDEIDQDETGFLRAILGDADDDGSLGSGAASIPSPFARREITVTALTGAESEIEETDVIVLANVGGLTPTTIETIESRVAAGGALLITLGDRIADPRAFESVNERLGRADGTGLLPARLRSLVEIADRRESYYRTAWFAEDHPALAFFADERWRPFLTEIPVFSFVAAEPREDARVLARLDDENSSPLLIERDYDRGRVFLWTTTIDKAWTRIPESPSTFIPLIHELFRYAAAGAELPRNAPVASSLRAEVNAFPRDPVLVRPDSSRRPLDGEAVAVGEGIWQLPPLPPLDAAGLWRIETEGAPALLFAARLDVEEGDLSRLDPRGLEAVHSALRYHEQGGDGGGSGDADGGADRGELWRWLAGAALAALILETLWAAWIGRGRRLV